jgi:hypothetical protein
LYSGAIAPASGGLLVRVEAAESFSAEGTAASVRARGAPVRVEGEAPVEG